VNFRSFLDFGTASQARIFTARKSDFAKVSKSTISSKIGSIFTLEKSTFSARSVAAAFAGAACAALFAAFFAAMTGLDPHAQVVIIFLPSVVFDLKEDPVEQSGFVAVHQLWKDTVVLVDQSEAFAGSCFPVAFHQLIFCNAHVRISIFFLGG